MNQSFRPRRSVLYLPGSNARAIEKARTLDADAIILDLEDAVAPDAKQTARAQVAEAVRAGGFGRRELIVRVNGIDTEWGEADFEAIAPAGPDAILVPKISTAEDVARYAFLVDAHGAPKTTGLWVMMETALAMLNAGSIAASSRTTPRLSAFVMGTNDLAKETGAAMVAGRLPMLSWLSTCLAAARAYGLAILDGVYNHLDDPDGFAAECAEARDLGMNGKTLIHPNQVAPCNAAFMPSEAEIAWSRTIMAAFDQPENAGKGAIRIEGKMVERLHADMARQLVAIADAVESE